MKKIIYALILSCFITFCFSTEIPFTSLAWSIEVIDIDLDGDLDIIVGHANNFHYNFGGISIIKNTGSGHMLFEDSLFIWGANLITCNLIDENEYPDIICTHITDEQEPENNREIAIVYNYGLQQFDSIAYFPLNIYEPIEQINTGDIDGDADIDIVYISNNGQFVGIINNNGEGIYEEPSYIETLIGYPSDIECTDFDNNGLDDIAFVEDHTWIYFSLDTGFQKVMINEDSFEYEIETIDFDNDNDTDVITLRNLYLVGLTSVKLFENEGNMQFTEHEEYLFNATVSHLEVCDLNNDNLPEIICSGDSNIYLIYNQDNYNLSEPEIVPVGYPDSRHEETVCADIDGNGRNDIVHIIYRGWGVPSILKIIYQDTLGNFNENPQTNSKLITKTGFNFQTYPNPVKDNLNLEYTILERGQVKISIYKPDGSLISKPVNEFQSPGLYRNTWDLKNILPKPWQGIYFITIHINQKKIATKKIILLD